MSPITRRQLLQRTAAVAPFAAFVPLSMGLGLRPVLAGDGPKRAIFFYIPDGCIPPLFHPTGGERTFQLSPMTQPLERVREDCVFVSGLTMYEGGNSHEGGMAKVVTGNADISLDVFLADQMRGETPVSSIYLGIHALFQNGRDYFSYLPGSKVRTPEDNPLVAFESIFGRSPGGGMTGGGAPAGTSVLDVSLAELAALRNQLGGAERAKLDLHVEGVREVERRLEAAAARLSGGATGPLSVDTFNQEGFSVPENDFSYPPVFQREDTFQLVAKLQTDLAVLALANDVTRVVSLQWSHPVSPSQLAFTGSTQRHHDASHYGAPTSTTAQNFILLQQYFTGRLANLIDRLRAVPDGEGTLLDNTVIVLFSELGDSNLHDHRNMPFVLAGRAGGALPTGRYLDYPEEAHSKLLVSIANAMGFSIDRFGYTGRGTGGLPGLLSDA